MAYTLVPTELIVDGAITSAKLDTNIAISGTLGVTGEVTLATHLNMGDNDKIKIGTGGDLEIYHDGSNSYISNSTGNIYLGDTNGAVHIQAKLNEESIICAADGAVSLYHDNAVKLATTSTGIDVTGVITTDGLTTSADINFGDNDKAVFGAGDDLQIYHNANTSFITESGSSNFKIGGENLYLQNTAHNENYLAAIANQGVTLYYNNAPKIATTSTGIDVTGTATMDGLTVDGGADASTSYARFTEYSSGYGFNGAYASYNGSSNELIFGRHNTFDSYIANDIPVMSFARSTGDISFYEDTGTTAKFFWDASAESLGIGTTSPSTKLHVHEAGASEPLGLFQTTTTGDCAVRIEGIGGESYLEIANTSATTGNTSNSWGIGSNDDTNLHIAYGTNGTMNKNSDNAQFFINSSTGNVGIGTESPNAKLTINNSIATTYSTTGYAATPAYSMLYLHNTNGGSNTASLINFRTGSGDGVIGFVEGGGTNDADFVIQTDGGSNGVERLRITNSGNVGIGTTSPDGKLDIEGNFESSKALVLTNTQGTGKVSYLRSHGGNGETLALYHDGSRRQIWDSSGHIAFENGGSERMRITSNGGIEASTTEAKCLQLNSTHTNGGYLSFQESGSTKFYIGRRSAVSGNSGAGYDFYAAGNYGLSFYANATRAMDIDTSGNLLVGITSPINATHTIYKELSNNNVCVFENSGTATPFGIQVRFTGEQTTRSDRYTYSSYHGTGSLALRFGVQTDGGIKNYSANNTNLSDRREKKNIEDADNTWSDVKQWSIRKYHYNIEQDESPKKIGVIAQEIEELDSNLVQSSFIDEQQNTERLYVKEQQMTWMAIKALQEAMIKIESLEARVTELES
ncbi:MAG: hypothetical protein CMJ25_12900 [Phycisphaerae bacterium]|nr:hypothetical protein [Phycisphaerae bacterium]